MNARQIQKFRRIARRLWLGRHPETEPSTAYLDGFVDGVAYLQSYLGVSIEPGRK